MANRFDAAGDAALSATNRALSAQMAERTGLNIDALNRLFPTQESKESLAQLMEIVTASTDHNQQIARFKERFEVCGGAALTLIKGLTKLG